MSVWREVTLGDLERESEGVIQTGPFGSQLHMSDYTEAGTPVVMPTNIRSLRLDPADIARVTENHVLRLSRHQLRAGDIVYSRRGDVEKCALVTEQEDGWLCGTGCLLVRVGGPNVDSRFLSYSLALPSTRAWITQHAVGATMPNLNTGILREVPVRLPEIGVQHAIAATLGALDDKIESNRRAVALIEELVGATFVEAFDVEHKHEGVPISDLIGVNSKRQLSRGAEATYIGMAALPENSMSIAQWETRPFGSGTKFVNGDVLMARITPCLENGKTAVIDMLQPDEVAWGSTEFVVLSPRGEISTPWIYSLVRSEPVRSFAIGRMSGTSGRQRFNANEFSGYRITPPSADKLSKFNELSVPAYRKAGQLRNENSQLAALRDALLPELLSGRIKVSEARETIEESIDEEVPHG